MEKYEGMTLNERLFLSGKMTEFNHACIKKDKEKAIEILKSVGVSDENIINNIFNPKKKKWWFWDADAG
jgi:hypothetical protein